MSVPFHTILSCCKITDLKTRTHSEGYSQNSQPQPDSPQPDVCYYIINTSTSDPQPSTAIANQLSRQLVSTEIRIIGLKCYKFIMALVDSVQIKST